MSWALKIMPLEQFFLESWASVQAPAGLAHAKQRNAGSLFLALSCPVSPVSRCASTAKDYPAICQLSSTPISDE